MSSPEFQRRVLIEWDDVYAYAGGLVEAGLITQEEVDCELMMFGTSEQNNAYMRLISIASTKQQIRSQSQIDHSNNSEPVGATKSSIIDEAIKIYAYNASELGVPRFRQTLQAIGGLIVGSVGYIWAERLYFNDNFIAPTIIPETTLMAIGLSILHTVKQKFPKSSK